MDINKVIQEIDIEIEKLQDAISEKEKKWDFNRSYNEFEIYLTPENNKISALYRKKRMIMPYELSELSDYGDVMSLKDFIQEVKDGGFIDDDGFGNYVKDNMETNIHIHPSDVTKGTIRKEFNTIIWYNK